MLGAGCLQYASKCKSFNLCNDTQVQETPKKAEAWTTESMPEVQQCKKPSGRQKSDGQPALFPGSFKSMYFLLKSGQVIYLKTESVSNKKYSCPAVAHTYKHSTES